MWVGLETVTLIRIAEVLYQAMPRSFRGIRDTKRSTSRSLRWEIRRQYNRMV